MTAHISRQIRNHHRNSSHLHRYLSTTLLALLLFFQPAAAADGDSNPAAADNTLPAPDIVYPEWFKTSFMELEEDILEARESGKRLMLVFHQPGCPYCNAFVERNLAQRDIEETVRSNFDVIEINMWGDLEVIDVDGKDFTEKTFARYLKVQFTPTVLMYDQDGAIALRINGYFPPDKFRAALNYVINETSGDLSFNEYLATLNPEIFSEQTKTVESQTYIDIDDFDTEGVISLPDKSRSKPYIILFEQKDCKNCQQLHDTVLNDETINTLLEQFDVIRLDMWGNDNIKQTDNTVMTGRNFAKSLGVSYAPTMVLFSDTHEEVIRSESWLKRFHTETILEYVLTGDWREQPSLQNYIRDRADAIRETGGTVNILE